MSNKQTKYIFIKHPDENWGLSVRSRIDSASERQLEELELLLLALERSRNALRGKMEVVKKEAELNKAAWVNVCGVAEDLQKQLTEAKRERDEWRKFGRQEALKLIVESDAESFPDKYQGSHALADTGDYLAHWNQDALKELLNVDTHSSELERLDGAYWEMMNERDRAIAELAQAREESIEQAQDAETRESMLRSDLELTSGTVSAYAEAARVIALHLADFCDHSLTYDKMIAEAARRAAADLAASNARAEQLRGAIKSALSVPGMKQTAGSKYLSDALSTPPPPVVSREVLWQCVEALNAVQCDYDEQSTMVNAALTAGLAELERMSSKTP